MKDIGGVWWPDRDAVAHRVIPSNLRLALPLVLGLLDRRGLALQAGGNVGLYPIALARNFEKVVTFEPDAENFDCLALNTKGIGNVIAYHAALGAGRSTAAVEAHSDNAGAHRVKAGSGPIAVFRIDDFQLSPDLIWLSVNGMHRAVLEGAAATIRRSSPAVIVSETHDDTGAARSFLRELGYSQAGKVPHRDYVMVRAA